jgi:DHA1 family bicyclomycin/chloramphenicol resistance-like MFS transporter
MAGANMPTGRLNGRSLLLLSGYLILISALVRLGSSLYLPALPMMADALTLSASQMASTMTLYLIGLAVASMALGPLSDRWGRRFLLLGGVLAFGIGSLLCAVASGYTLLITGRLLQSTGSAAVLVGARAVSREAFDDTQMITVLGWISLITSLAPLLAPLLGGVMTSLFGWQANFWLMVGCALAVVTATYRSTPETLRQPQANALTLHGMVSPYGAMLTAPGFILPTLPVMFCFAVQGAYLVASPFIFIQLFGFSPLLFGMTSLALVIGLLIGRLLCMSFIRRHGEAATFVGGALLACLGGLLSLLIVLTDWITPITLLAASTVFSTGFGTLAPIGMRAGLSLFPDRVGSASALYGTLTLGATAIGSGIIGGLLQQQRSDIALLCLATFVAGVAILLISLRAHAALAARSASTPTRHPPAQV